MIQQHPDPPPQTKAHHDDPAPPIAQEGWPFVAMFAFATVCIWGAVTWWLGAWGYIPAAIGVVLTAWCLWFFRDPGRNTPRDENLAFCPADGRIVMVGAASPPPELGLDPAATVGMQRVCVFMNVFNVHVNRSPVAGEVIASHYHPGKFFNAALDKASEHNERFSVALRLPDGRIMVVVQIAGLIARRIVCKVKPGTTLRAGQRYGLIRFGSRVDVYLPRGFVPVAKVGEHSIAGETVVARDDGSRAQR